MKDERNTGYWDDVALDILEEGENISGEHVELLKANAGLRKRCRELMEYRAIMKKADNEPDIDNLLPHFHRTHAVPHSKARRLTLTIATIAAVLAGIFFLLYTPERTTTPSVKTANIFKQSTLQRQTATANTHNTASAGTQAISLIDYRKALTEDADIEKFIANVPKGQSACVSLPDGSRVYLHPGSRLRYPKEFIGDKRYVILEGEAYFQVMKDRAKPFIVQSDHITTMVLGTEFNVKGSEVTLITGSVQVENTTSHETRTITPGKQVTLSGNGFKIDEVDTLPYVYWRDGYLYYDNMELGDIVRAIGEAYDLPVTFLNTSALRQRLRFISERDKGVDTVLERLNKMKKVHAFRKDGRIIVE